MWYVVCKYVCTNFLNIKTHFIIMFVDSLII